MSELLELQRRVAAAIMHPLTGSETMPRKRRDGASNAAEADALIKPNDRLSSFERLEIYNRQYWFRLYSSFEEDFPGLTECPSQSFSLRNLGSQLESWLRAHPEYVETRFDLALDMVRLEWAHIEVFDSGEAALLDPDDLASIDESSVLHLQPYLRLLQLHYPVDDLLIELRSESGSSDASSNNASVSRRTRQVRRVAMLTPERIYLAVHRHQNSVYYKRLHAEDYRLLEALIAGRPIGDAIDAAFQESTIAEDERGAFLQQAFASWAALGWFVRQERLL
jgi:hypothetical protein